MPDAPETLKTLFQAGVDAVGGKTAVANALAKADIASVDAIIAVGKAATAMALAAHESFPQAPVLIVTKYGHAENAPAQAEVIEAAHPVLDDNGIKAGARLRGFVDGMPEGSHLLVLISGGASALAELPVDGHDLASLKERTEELLRSGADIHEMNAIRKTLSQIKGGKLFAGFRGARISTLAISDVEGDALSVIGSGLGDADATAAFEFTSQIVASNAIAREAVTETAKTQGLRVKTNLETLYADVTTLGSKLARSLVAGPSGLHIWGGEPTVVLPENPGQGGRNQALALLIAREIAGHDGITVLVAGTDGTDGPTDAAGAIVDARTWDETGAEALARADAGPWLEARGALLKTGPTGTNVMDLVIALKD